MKRMPKSNATSPLHAEKGHIFIHVLVTLFGVAAWIGINGIFVQLPALISIAPEGWNLPVYTVLVIQAANVGPLLYTLLQHFHCTPRPTSCILCLLVAGTAAMLLLVFFYPETVAIGGTEHSLALFLLIFVNALVGCFSSVLFMPYLHDFNKIYMVSYFIGEGLSGVLPSTVALFQGVSNEPDCVNDTLSYRVDAIQEGLNFSPGDYFIFLTVILMFSLMAFILLEHSPYVRKKKNDRAVTPSAEEAQMNGRYAKTSNAEGNSLYLERRRRTEDSLARNDTERQSSTNDGIKLLSRRAKIYLLVSLSILCFFGNGFLPSIQSYSCLPYGAETYKLSITLSQIANPLACFLGLWLLTSNLRAVSYLQLVTIAIGVYVTYLAVMSPVPPWQDSHAGMVFAVVAWTVLVGLISYLKLIIVSTFRAAAAERTLFIVGAVMQAGSASGAIVSFLLVNLANVFTMYDTCANK